MNHKSLSLIKQMTLASAILFGITACNSGGNASNNNNTNSNSLAISASSRMSANQHIQNTQNISGGVKDPQTSGYTMIVGAPYNTAGDKPAAQFYNDLLTRITNQSSLKISRILLNVDNPAQNPDIYGLNTTVANSGLAIQFIESVAKYNLTAQNKIEIYAFTDVEAGDQYGWGAWSVPADSVNIPSCNNVVSQNDLNHANMLKSVCWASYVNKLIVKDGYASNSIVGNAYDGQKSALQDTDLNREWLYNQESADNLNLGWISSGLKSWVNLNLIEVYDLDKGNDYATPRLDTVAPDGVDTLTTIYNMATKGQDIGMSVNYANGVDTLTGSFPGPQKLLTLAPGNAESDFESGMVGANIYQCAINHGSSDYGCDSTYTNNVDINATPDQQIMQSFGHIFNNAVDSPLGNNVYGAIPPATGWSIPQNSSVVYLLSTQYIGPVGSYAGSGKQCIDGANCSCVASKYNPQASCGDENGFGSWGNYLSQFQSVASSFLTSQGCDSTNFPGGCGMGIYMYDYIPQQWFNN